MYVSGFTKYYQVRCFNPEEGGRTYIENVGKHLLENIASHARRQHIHAQEGV
jgi:hypothetical protein